ncbi:MAG: alkaline phosphatase [Deltaproteobacteria bacterium]|nr:alkaline phosphatase [Deltaproteobacteria bacterium]
MVTFVASAAYAGQGKKDFQASHSAHPKYVFFFLGDGMSQSQIQATEAYLTQSGGGSAREAADLLKPENRLNMSKMPVAGIQTTFDAHALMTDSASSATAFASGIKTLSGVIGMNDGKTISYKSIAQLAHEQGRKVGIVTSVSLDHATPAAYYASVSNRGYMNNIATQLANSGYEFFGGGGLVRPTGATAPDTNNNIWNLLSSNGYEVRNTKALIEDLLINPVDKVVAINPWLQDASAMPYAIDMDQQPDETFTLAEMTEIAIEVLSANKGLKKGFFLMVEGGKIDWACHANDAMATIGDMIDFDDAIAEALAFYAAHPRDTLIVVTGDHETGGMTVGHATTGYTAYYDRILGQKNSFQYFGANQWAAHEAANEAAVCPNVLNTDNLATNTDMLNLMSTEFGLNWNDLNPYQKKKLEDAYDMSLCETNSSLPSENTLLYGGYEPIIVTINHILNERASIGWTSYSHTGVPVPVFAQGREAENFYGFYDNTDIAKKLARIMGIKQSLPVVK